MEKGNIAKVYGGVMAKVSSKTIPINYRENANADAKQIIGALAAELIRDDSTVYLDSGTSMSHVLPHLENRRNVTVITNNLRVMEEVSKLPNISLLALGGYYNAATSAFAGSATSLSIERLTFDLAFLGTTGVSLERGLRINTYFEESIKRSIIENNRGRVVLLADSNKFDKSVLITYGSLEDISYLVTERSLPERYAKKVKACGIHLICPEYA